MSKKSKIRSGGLIYVISVVLVTGFIGLCPSQAQEVENLLDNGGFETGDLTAWAGGGDVGSVMTVVNMLAGAEIPEDPIEGDFCLHINVQEEGPNGWDSQLKYYGLVFEEGKIYTLSAFLKSDDEMQVRLNPQLSEDPYTSYGAQTFTTTNEWQEYYITTPPMPETVDPANHDFHFNYGVGEFWIDDIKWYEGEYVPSDLSISYKALDPIPDDGTLLTDFPGGLLGTGLMWTAGPSAVTHDVYFGTNYDDVTAGTGGTFMGNQSEKFFYVGYGYMPNDPLPDGLVPGTTYYWICRMIRSRMALCRARPTTGGSMRSMMQTRIVHGKAKFGAFQFRTRRHIPPIRLMGPNL
jgi:hypothetical protein